MVKAMYLLMMFVFAAGLVCVSIFAATQSSPNHEHPPESRPVHLQAHFLQSNEAIRVPKEDEPETPKHRETPTHREMTVGRPGQFSAAAKSSARSPPAAVESFRSTQPSHRKIVVLGDIHGSVRGLRGALRAGQLIDDAGNFTNATVL
jgi:hypothetical protein